MKKPLAIILLIIGGAAAVSLIAFLTVVVFVVLSMFIKVGWEWMLYTIAALFVFSLSYLSKHPRAYYKKKHNINAAVFTACVCAPSLITAAVFYFTHTPAPNEESGVDAVQVWLLFWLLSTAVFTVGMIFRACAEVIQYKLEHRH